MNGDVWKGFKKELFKQIVEQEVELFIHILATALKNTVLSVLAMYRNYREMYG